MQRVPYEGTSRMTTSLRRRQRDRVVRRGLAMMIEVRRSPITVATPFGQSLTRVHVCLAERLLRVRTIVLEFKTRGRNSTHTP